MYKQTNSDASLARIPRVWVLRSHRAGETSQGMALAEALGWPFETKQLTFREYVPHFMIGALLIGVVRSRSSALSPPWPDLVISAGVRNEPVARWIKQNADRPVRLVFLGRTWARLELFDLVATTPQYRIHKHPRVLHNTTTMHRVTEQRLTEAAAKWSPRLKNLPTPYIAVAVGGNSGPYTLGRGVADRLGRQASAMAEACGGALLVTTSARTPSAATTALANAITAPVKFFQWSPGAVENPYFAFLALANSIIVTGDSIAMLTDACATRKPVYIFDLGECKHSMKLSRDTEKACKSSTPWWKTWDKDLPRALVYRLGMKIAPLRLTRDIRIVHEKLVQSGHAAWLGDEFPAQRPPPLNDVARAVERIRAMFRAQASTEYGSDAPTRNDAPKQSREESHKKVCG